MDKDTYKKLLSLEKILTNKQITVASQDEQRKYPSREIFSVNHKFETVMNRKGHKRDKLSLMMNSNDGNMMRFDIIGKPHQGYPTPHLHVFTGENTFDSKFLSSEELPYTFDEIVSNPSAFKKDLKLFLKYNNVELKNVIFYDSSIKGGN